MSSLGEIFHSLEETCEMIVQSSTISTSDICIRMADGITISTTIFEWLTVTHLASSIYLKSTPVDQVTHQVTYCLGAASCRGDAKKTCLVFGVKRSQRILLELLLGQEMTHFQEA